jgi:head-tail adaptor
MAGAGYWRMRFKYQMPTVTVSSSGQATTTWSDVVTVAGMITPNQREVLDDLGVAIRTDLVIETGFCSDIKAVGRLIDIATTAVYNVIGVIDPDGGKRKRLRITATAIDQTVIYEYSPETA